MTDKVPLASPIELIGGSAEEQRAFVEAVSTLPAQVIAIIANASIRFRPTHTSTTRFAGENTIEFSRSWFAENKKDPAALPALIFGYGLAHSKSFDIPKDLFDRAIKQQTADIAVYNAQENSHINSKKEKVPLDDPMMIRRSQLLQIWSKRSDAMNLGEILEATYGGFIRDKKNNASVGPNWEVLNHVLVKATDKSIDQYVSEQDSGGPAFHINRTVLTPPQQRYFEKLNEVITLLGVTPKEFDDQFRVVAVAQFIAQGEQFMKYAAGAYADVARGLDRDIVKDKLTNFDNWSSNKFNLARKLPLTFIGKPKGGKYDRERALELASLEQTLYPVWTIKFEPHLGISDVNYPALMMPWEEELVRCYTKGSTPDYDKIPPHLHEAVEKVRGIPEFKIDHPSITAEQNLLQLYANATKPLHLLVNTDRLTSVVDNITGILPSPDEYFNAAIHNAVFALAEKKTLGAPAKQRLTAKLQEIEELWPQVVMSKEQYQGYLIEAAKHDALKDTEAARLERERLDAEAKLAQKPEAFIITAPAWNRINKTASRELHPRLDPDEQELIKNMRTLKQGIEPFTQVDKLDIKIPQHHALAKFLLGDAVLTRLEYVFRPKASKDAPRIDAGLQQQIREAISAVYTINPTAPDITPGRLAANEQLKKLIEKSPALVIAALGSDEQFQQLRQWQQQLQKEDTTADARNVVHYQLCNLSYGLLKSAAVEVIIPPPDIAMVTAAGKILITESSLLSETSTALFTLTPAELNVDALAEKLIAADEKLSALIRRAKIDGSSALASYEATRSSLQSLFDDKKEEQAELFAHLTRAFNSTDAGLIPLNEAILSVLPPLSSQTGIVEDKHYPITQALEEADRFAREAIALQPPHTLFSCYLNPMIEKHNPVELRMYSWTQGTDGRLTVQKPPVGHSILTGTSLDHGLDIMQRIQSHILGLPGVSAYRKVDDPKIIIADDLVIPNASITNGDGRGELVKQNGVFRLRLRYQDPTSADICISLGLVQDEQNRTMARERADQVIHQIERLQEARVLVTRNDMVDWLQGQYLDQWQSASVDMATRRVPVNFPTGKTTNLVLYPPSLEGTPSDMWKQLIGFEVNGHIIKAMSVSLHIKDEAIAQQRVERTVNALRTMLENQPSGTQWALNGDHKLLRFDDELKASHPDEIDETRLRDICNLSARFVVCHEAAVRDDKVETDGRHSITLGLQRNYNGQAVDEWFNEQPEPNNSPKILERKIYLPANANPDVKDSLIGTVRNLIQQYLHRDYGNFTEALYEPNLRPQLRKPKAYHPSSFPNLLEDAIATALRDPKFVGCTTDFALPKSSRVNEGEKGSRGVA